MGSIYVGGSKVKKIYVGTQMVKKVYVGNTLVWSANETGYWNSTDLVKRFGGNHFYFVIYFAVLEKDYANNRMRVKYEVGMGSDDGYHISASTNRTGSGSVDGQRFSWTGNAQFRRVDIKYYIKMKEYGLIMLVAALFHCQLLTLLKLMYQE